MWERVSFIFKGASLRAAGWKCIGQAGGLRWTGRRKPTVDLYPAQMKVRYQREVDSGCFRRETWEEYIQRKGLAF